MSFSKVHSAQTHLLKAHIIDIEIDISKGLHAFSVVGLASQSVEESKDRISAALKNSGFESPKSQNQKITISLAPADLKKDGPAFDLGIALGYLLASGTITFDPKNKLFLGELSLNGQVRRVQGTLALIIEAQRKGFTEVFVPKENAEEAGLVRGITIFPVENIKEVIEHLNTIPKNGKVGKSITPQEETRINPEKNNERISIDDIEGQKNAKRALTIAASGGHNIAFYGPPGTGKTMLARAFQDLLLPLSFEEAIEVTAIHSIAGTLTGPYINEAPFRTPHHTASYVSLVGGGANLKPGEVTLAHRGVLFLDEFPEFDRKVIETLRQPLEDHMVSVSRAKGTAHFPARFILIATMNPCPCGNHGIEGKRCTCTQQTLLKYQKKISGPIIDRIDMWVEVSKIDHEAIVKKKTKTNEREGIKELIHKTRAIQRSRFQKEMLNGDMNAKSLHSFTQLSEEGEKILTQAAKNLDLSARACHRIIKLARTIADIDNKEKVEKNHILEALQYRPKKDS